ncbi:DUF1490 domain-containing protein, partial [Dysosmobacter welbionis]
GDLDGGRGRAGQRGKHNAAKRIAQSGAVAALQRFHHILAVCGVPRRLDALNLGLFNFDHAVVPSFIFLLRARMIARRRQFLSLLRVSS